MRIRLSEKTRRGWEVIDSLPTTTECVKYALEEEGIFCTLFAEESELGPAKAAAAAYDAEVRALPNWKNGNAFGVYRMLGTPVDNV